MVLQDTETSLWKAKKEQVTTEYLQKEPVSLEQTRETFVKLKSLWIKQMQLSHKSLIRMLSIYAGIESKSIRFRRQAES